MMNGAKAIVKKYNEVSLILRIVVGLVIGAVLWIIMSRILPKDKTVQSKLDDVTRLTKENLSGARVVRALGAEERLTKASGEAR